MLPFCFYVPEKVFKVRQIWQNICPVGIPRHHIIIPQRSKQPTNKSLPFFFGKQKSYKKYNKMNKGECDPIHHAKLQNSEYKGNIQTRLKVIKETATRRLLSWWIESTSTQISMNPTSKPAKGNEYLKRKNMCQ